MVMDGCWTDGRWIMHLGRGGGNGLLSQLDDGRREKDTNVNNINHDRDDSDHYVDDEPCLTSHLASRCRRPLPQRQPDQALLAELRRLPQVHPCQGRGLCSLPPG
jgi:hypothetical protein